MAWELYHRSPPTSLSAVARVNPATGNIATCITALQCVAELLSLTENDRIGALATRAVGAAPSVKADLVGHDNARSLGFHNAWRG